MEDEENHNTPVLYRFQHKDGLKMSMLLIEGIVHDFTFAADLAGQDQPLSAQFFLPPREVCNFFRIYFEFIVISFCIYLFFL